MSGFFRRLLDPGGKLRAASGPVRPVGSSSADTGKRGTLEDLRVHPGPPVPTARLPRVAVVILNYNGLRHLDGCFESLAAVDYPKAQLDVLLIDNGSEDGSVERMREAHGWVRTFVNASNTGFAGGCNQGAELATDAEVLVFLNNDMRVEPNFLHELVAPIVREECVCTTGKMYSWDGKLINSAGGGMNFHGIGIQTGYMEEPGPEHDIPRLSLFACGGAMAIRRNVYLEVGGFDPEFFAYYEDVDLGWRLWILGHEIHYVPSAVCYHHHSSTSRAFPPETVRLLQIRNPLYACFKNYDDEHLRTALPALLALASRRMMLVAGLPSDRPFRIEHATTHASGGVGKLLAKAKQALDPNASVAKISLADMLAMNDLLGNWDHWMRRRAQIQELRRRPDAEIFRLFLRPLWCVEEEPAYQALQAGLTSFLGIDRWFEGLTVSGREPQK